MIDQKYESLSALAQGLIFGGMEEFAKFYGLYRGVVTDNRDPDQLGRIQVIVAGLGLTTPMTNVWLEPFLGGTGINRGSFCVPEIGDPVRVVFEKGDASRPKLYLPGWYDKSYKPDEFKYDSNGRPIVKGYISRLGHRFLISDEPGNEAVQISCHQPETTDKALTDFSVSSDRTTGKHSFVNMDGNGNILLLSHTGSHVNIDADNKAISIVDENGNSISMDEDGIKLIDKNGNAVSISGDSIDVQCISGSVNINASTVNVQAGNLFLGKGATFSSVLGEALIAYLSTHTHATTVPGTPTSPPIVPPQKSLLLSSSVKIKK